VSSRFGEPVGGIEYCGLAGEPAIVLCWVKGVHHNQIPLLISCLRQTEQRTGGRCVKDFDVRIGERDVGAIGGEHVDDRQRRDSRTSATPGL